MGACRSSEARPRWFCCSRKVGRSFYGREVGGGDAAGEGGGRDIHTCTELPAVGDY